MRKQSNLPDELITAGSQQRRGTMCSYYSLSILFLLSSFFFASTSQDGCPVDCVCKWKSGKETTLCLGLGLEAIPREIAAGTQVIDLRGNSISVLKNDVFLDLGITNLQRIYFSDCELSEVEPDAFRRLTNLVELDLSDNLLREIPSEAWKAAQALMRLNLGGNPVKLIRRGAFSDLRFVANLQLDRCEIETIETGAFLGMDSLLELRLEANRLNYLHGGAGLFPRSLHHVEGCFWSRRRLTCLCCFPSRPWKSPQPTTRAMHEHCAHTHNRNLCPVFSLDKFAASLCVCECRAKFAFTCTQREEERGD